jgi:hypothetical protein
MHWKFSPILQFSVHHEKYPPASAADPLPTVGDFSLQPSGHTARRFREMNWVFRPQTGGGLVFAEKPIAPDGSATLRGRPWDQEGFTFFLCLSKPNLLAETRPYTAAVWPPFSGRSRVLWMDSLQSVAQADGSFSLSGTHPVDVAQLASRMPSPVHFTAASGVNQIEVTALATGAAAQVISLNNPSRKAAFDLPENGYRFTQLPANQSETIFFSPETLPKNCLGVCRIYAAAGNLWEPKRHFRIFFVKP